MKTEKEIKDRYEYILSKIDSIDNQIHENKNEAIIDILKIEVFNLRLLRNEYKTYIIGSEIGLKKCDCGKINENVPNDGYQYHCPCCDKILTFNQVND